MLFDPVAVRGLLVGGCPAVWVALIFEKMLCCCEVLRRCSTERRQIKGRLRLSKRGARSAAIWSVDEGAWAVGGTAGSVLVVGAVEVAGAAESAVVGGGILEEA